MLEVLHRIGERWRAVLGDGRRRPRLPVDPDRRATDPGRTRRYERLIEIGPASGTFSPLRPGELLADRAAMAAPTNLGRAVLAARRFLLGPPLATTALVQEPLSRVLAVAVLSSDALSSVTYGTEAMLSVLVFAGRAPVSPMARTRSGSRRRTRWPTSRSCRSRTSICRRCGPSPTPSALPPRAGD